MKTLRITAPVILLIICLVGCHKTLNRPMLAISVDEDMRHAVTISFNDCGYVHTICPMTDSEGKLIFNPDMTASACNISVRVGNHIYGAYIEKNKCVQMKVTDNCVAYSGDNVEINLFFNQYEKTFAKDMWLAYSSRAPFIYKDAITRLETGTSKTREALAFVTDNYLRDILSQHVDNRKDCYARHLSELDRSQDIKAFISALDSLERTHHLTGLPLKAYYAVL